MIDKIRDSYGNELDVNTFYSTLSEYANRKSVDCLTWQDIADEMNSLFSLEYTESFYRKRYRSYIDSQANVLFEQQAVQAVPSDLQSISDTIYNQQDYLTNYKNDELDSRSYEDKKDKAKLREIQNQINFDVRRISREETLKEIAREASETIGRNKILPSVFVNPVGDKSAILVLSDWHYGVVCDNAWNKYNPEVCEKRIAKLLSETVRTCKENNVRNIVVLNLSDLVCGRIHLTLRLQSRFDVITQVIRVSEILAEFLNDLSNQGFYVDYYDCCDNHSRIEPNKKESMQLETLTRITSWYLKNRFSDSNIVKIHDNTFGQDIITFNLRGHNYIAVHGDNDKVHNIVEKLTSMTGNIYDGAFVAHNHHFGMDEQYGCVVVENGSLMGTDSYAVQLRLRAHPSQNLVIVTDDDPTYLIRRIYFKD